MLRFSTPFAVPLSSLVIAMTIACAVQTARPDGPLPLESGVFVEEGVECENPASAYTIVYSGKGFDAEHTECKITNVRNNGNIYNVTEQCIIDGRDTIIQHETITVESRTSFLFEGMYKKAMFHYCGNPYQSANSSPHGGVLIKALVTLNDLLGLVLYFLFPICVFVLLPMSFIKHTRNIAGTGFIISSYIFGLTLWILCIGVTLRLLGLTWMFVGLFSAGVGVIPLAIIACFINGEPAFGLSIIVSLAMTFGARYLGIHLLDKGKQNN